MNFIELKSGISVEGDDIHAFKTDHKSSQYIYLMAGVHGDEVEGIFVLQELKKWLESEDGLDLPLVLVPILNVDGHRNGSRINSHGVDLNRNLPAKSWVSDSRGPKYNPGDHPLSEPENQFLVKLFEKYPPKIIFSFHSWKPLINYNGDCKDIAEFLHRYNNYPISDDTAGHPTPGSLGDYAPETFKCPVITFECPPIRDDLTLKDIWEENRKGLEALFFSDLLF